jgi:hypothetical protein
LSSDNNNTNQVTTTEDQPLEKDELSQSIKEQQELETSYILEVSKTDEQRSKYLAKKNDFNVLFEDGKTVNFKRKPLGTKKNKEIDDLRIAYFNNRNSKDKITALGKEYDTANDVLYEAFKKTAMYCLGMTEKQYDESIWEDDQEWMPKDVFGLRSILAACLLRAVHGVAYFPQPSKNG